MGKRHEFILDFEDREQLEAFGSLTPDDLKLLRRFSYWQKTAMNEAEIESCKRLESARLIVRTKTIDISNIVRWQPSNFVTRALKRLLLKFFAGDPAHIPVYVITRNGRELLAFAKHMKKRRKGNDDHALAQAYNDGTARLSYAKDWTVLRIESHNHLALVAHQDAFLNGSLNYGAHRIILDDAEDLRPDVGCFRRTRADILKDPLDVLSIF